MAEHHKSYRSSVGHAKGLGAAHSGTHHWWMQRLSAIALMPCGLWLLYALIKTRHYDYQQLLTWLGQPMHAVLMLSTVWIGLYHSMLGMQVIIEDYVHQRYIKMALIVALKLTMFLLAVMALVAIFICIGART